MKKDPTIQRAIDESLSSVHFSAADMHHVMRAVRSQEAPVRIPRAKKRAPFRLMMATAMAALVIVPVSLLVLRAGSAKPTDITTIASQGDPQLSATCAPTAAPRIGVFTEDDAIAAARACFETHCDTTIFTFDEYTVDVQATHAYGSDPDGHDYQVTMNSIYGNGCSFRVVVSAQGEILSYSTPRLATVPTRLSNESEEIRSWYEKYGEQLLTWPLDVQAEFSRRYEGGLLRAPREGDMSAETVLSSARDYARDALGLDPSQTIHAYCMLCSERAFSDGAARYQVYCFTDDLSAGMPEDCLLLTINAATGEIESSEISPTEGW